MPYTASCHRHPFASRIQYTSFPPYNTLALASFAQCARLLLQIRSRYGGYVLYVCTVCARECVCVRNTLEPDPMCMCCVLCALRYVPFVMCSYVCVGCGRCVVSRVLSAAVRAYSPYLSLLSAADSAAPLALCKKRLTCHRHHCRSCIGFAQSAAALLALSTSCTSAVSAMYCELSLFNYSAVDFV